LTVLFESTSTLLKSAVNLCSKLKNSFPPEDKGRILDRSFSHISKKQSTEHENFPGIDLTAFMK